MAAYSWLLFGVHAAFFVLLWCSGMFFNAVLLTVFLRHPETRTPENMLLINLCIDDVAYLLSFFLQLLPHCLKLNKAECLVILFCRSFCIALSIVSIVAISIQRYFGISKTKNRIGVGDRGYTKSLMVLAGVWALASALAGAEVYRISVQYKAASCSDHFFVGDNSFRLMVYGFVPCTIIMIFYGATACVIRRSARRLPGVPSEALAELQKRRKVSAAVVSSLTTAFSLTYLPMFISICLMKRYGGTPHWISRLHVAFATVMSILGPLANPLALYRSSTMLRPLMDKYGWWFCKSKSAPTESQDDLPLSENPTRRL